MVRLLKLLALLTVGLPTMHLWVWLAWCAVFTLFCAAFARDLWRSLE